MQNAIDSLLSQLASLLGPLSPFAKAVVPAALTLAYAIVRCVVDGKVDATSLVVAGGGVLIALVTFLVPNEPKPTPAPSTKAKRAGK